jgi:hypothetical protein
MQKECSLQDHVKEMRALALLLISHTFPIAEFDEEFEILPLKCRTILVDGYELQVTFSIAEYPKYMVESIQIQSLYTPFIPFNVVCKVARFFLGKKNLAYTDFLRNNKKVYCWTVRKKDGVPITPNDVAQNSVYEGFEYSILNPGSLDLYES